LAIVNVIISASIVKCGSVKCFGLFIERYDESPVIYYENKGVTVLYNIARTIAYVNLNKLDNETLVLRQLCTSC